jgi:cytoskeleton protein RodZ
MSSTPFGEHLKRERELRGVSLDEIAAATRISTRFLEALEKEQWDRLPGGAFNRGFVRSIARFLGMDEDGLVAEYAYEHKSLDEPRSAGHAQKIPRAWGSVVVAALLAAVFVAGGFWVFAHFRVAILARLHGRFAGGAAANQGTVAASPSDTVTSPSGAALPGSQGQAPVGMDLALTIQATKPADLTVSADGQKIFAGSLQANEVKQFQAQETLEIASNDSTAFLLTLNGHSMRWAGTSGEPGEMRLTRNNLGTPPEASH